MPQQTKRKLSRFDIIATVVCLIAIGGLGAYLLSDAHTLHKSTNQQQATDNSDPASLAELLALLPGELEEVDLARANLLSATGLPGSDNLNINAGVAKLDSWADHVELETQRNFHQFLKDPGNFNGSEAYFRMLMLVTVLQQDFGVRYNPERIRDIDFTRSQDHVHPWDDRL